MFSCFSFRSRRANSCPSQRLPTLYTSMDYLEKAGRVLDIEIFELKRLRERLGENFSRAVELIKETVDARAMVLLEARGFNKEDFAKFHPGGMIGRSMLTRVHQVMRPREAMAIVSTDTPVRDVLKAMTNVRAGAAVVTDENQKLLGIFTHGDFVRHFQFDSKIGERLVADLMTLNPVTVHKDKLAVEVLNLLERHRIDDLVVVDDDSVPVGIVDSQDLTRLKLL